MAESPGLNRAESSIMTPRKKLIFTEEQYDADEVRISTTLARSQALESPGFIFVNADQSSHGKQQKALRKVVRSTATIYSHRVAPRRVSRQERVHRPLRIAQDEIGSSRASIASMDTDSSSPKVETQKLSRQSSSGSCSAKPTESDVSALALANISRKRAALSPPTRHIPSPSSSNDSLSPGDFELRLPGLQTMDASSRDPFSTYPVHYRPWYGKLLHFWYNVVFKRSTGVLKASVAEIEAYTIWSRRQEMSEPVLFYTSLFLASGIPVAEGMFPISAALWLRQKAVEAMKSALDDPVRALSTPVILAVGRIALHEHIYGNREVAHGVHRRAQLRMVTLRGGLTNLGLPRTTIQLILWTDALMSAEAGTEPFFADIPKRIQINSYTAQEATHVTNHCSPQRFAHPGYDPKDEAS